MNFSKTTIFSIFDFEINYLQPIGNCSHRLQMGVFQAMAEFACGHSYTENLRFKS